MRRRLLSLILAFVMVLGMLPASALAAETQDYELKVLTFEDADYKATGTNYAGGTNWSSLIDSPQYQGPLLYPSSATTAYNWYDEGNTYLKHAFADEWGDHQYWGGGHAISNYNSADVETYGSFDAQLTVFNKTASGLATTGGGHNGSNNFAMHYGYVDNSGYGGSIQQSLSFGDNKARVIDHMYVNNSTYAINCYVNGNGLTANIGESDWVKLVATGYNGSTKTGTAEMYLVNGPSNIVMDWTKFDLSDLGEVTKVEFNVTGSSDNGYGFSQPAYFAYDDVAVRFPVTTTHTHTYGDPTWTWAEDYSTASAAFACTDADDTQNVEAVITSASTATCTEAGKLTYTATATFNEKEYTDTREVDAEATGHTDSDGNRICDTCETSTNSLPTLIEGVEPTLTVKIQTGFSYQLFDLVNGKIFEDADDTLTYENYFYYTSKDGGETWNEEPTYIEALLHGGISNTITNSTEGTYTYKFYAFDDYGVSEDTWTLNLQVMDVVPADVNFYVGKDQNGNYPVLELYKTAGIDEDLFDYVGWFTNAAGETEYVYNPQDYTILDGETDYVVIDGVNYELHDYEKIEFTNSAFDASATDATASGTVVNNYNMFYASVVTGRYSTRGYGLDSSTGEYDIYLGGQSMELPMEQDIYGGGGDNIYLSVVSVYTTSKKLDNTYFTADDYYVEMIMPVTGSMIHSGDPYVSGNYTRYPFLSYAAGNGSLYNIYAYPYDTENYIFNQSINNTTAASYGVVNKSITIASAVTLTVNVPKSADFGLYFQYNNFNTKEVAPEGEAVVNSDGTKTLTYKVSKNNGNYTWRLSDPSGNYINKAGWLANLTAATEKTITFSEETNEKTHSFSGLGTTVINRDEADIQVFLDHDGFMSTSGTYRVRAFRMWQLINSDTANIMVEPDMNIQVLQGNASDVSLVSGGNAVDNWIDVTPTTTDIIAVNYDAIEMYSTADNYGSHGGLFPATNPERTGVFVITNAGEGSADANVMFNGGTDTHRGSEWDYNYDTWYYLNTDEAPTLDFTVTSSSDVSVSYATVITNSALQSSLSGWTSVTADESGNYSASMLAFRNAGTLGGTVIIRMTDSTGTSYRLVRVAEMTATVTNVSNPGEPFMPGNEASITFDGLYRSVNKVSGIFNPLTYYLRYNAGETQVNGSLPQYQKMDNASITLTIPEDITFPEGESSVDYSFNNGHIYGSMYSASSPFDTLYNMTDTGVGTNFSAVSVNFVLSNLADIPVTVYKTEYYDVEIAVTDGENALTDYTLTLTDPEGNALTADENGIYQDLVYGDYGYTLSKNGYVCSYGEIHLGSADADSVSEEGILTKTLTLAKAAEGAWDGATATEPATDANGVYQIGTGAELAWFAQTVNAGTNSISAVLTADIDLAAYAWTPIGNSSTKFTGSFDGQNHTISNLYINYSATTTTSPYLGLFGSVSSSKISNLSVSGEIAMTSTGSVSTAYSGGVIGAASGGSITNVHSDVDITVTRVKGNWARVGGIVGSTSSSTVITNCSNSGDISGYQYVGGIAGYSIGTITGCYNSGDISGYQYIAGIAGSGAPATITACYNIGDLTCTYSYVGGIISNASSTSGLTNCFNAGSITFGGTTSYSGAVVGYSNNASGTNANLYYLEGTYSTGIGTNKNTVDATAVSAETLASDNFVRMMNVGLDTPAFAKGSGHPILSWQDSSAEVLAPISVTGVTLDKDTAVVEPGKTLQLTATIAPEDATIADVTWTTSDAAIATVDETGLVTAVAAGEAIITATTVDGAFTATCTVTVAAAVSGDIDGNGTADVTDAALLYKYNNNDKETLTDDQLALSDLNKDGVVDIIDAALLYKFVNNKITEFPVSE